MSDHINQIKNRILTSSLIGRYVTLKAKPRGEFTGLCPFHAENTPSFTVNDSKAFYHCFGCQEHGDIFSFIMKMENCDYKTALERLAKEAGISLPVYSKQAKEQADAQQVLYRINDIAANYYQQCLMSPMGKQALAYLQARGLSREIIGQYRLGYAPNSWHELYQLLKNKHHFNDEQIATSQALRRSEHGWYNMFRNRVIFPIQDKQSRVLAFGGRILGEGEPKYLNSPESPIFTKGEHLYALNHAYKSAVKQQNIILVEGYMDVIGLALHGIDNAVAPLGTSLKVSQIQALWHIVPEPTICLDADASGQRATAKVALEMMPLLKPGYSVKICQLSGGKDPDEVVAKHGVEFFQRLVQNSIPLGQFVFTQVSADFDLKTPEGQAACEQYLQSLTKQIAESSLQKNYYFFFRDALRNYLWQKKQERSGYGANRGQNQHINQIKEHLLPESIINSSIVTILMVLFCYPEMLRDTKTVEQLADLEISCKLLDKIRNNLLSMEGYELVESGKLDKEKLHAAFYAQLKPDDGLLRAAKCVFLEIDNIRDELTLNEYLSRAFKVASLSILGKQIIAARRFLSANPDDEAHFTRLTELKNHEEHLKNELGII